jgi:hypothetical protein
MCRSKNKKIISLSNGELVKPHEGETMQLLKLVSGVGGVVEHLPSKYETLSSAPVLQTTQTKKLVSGKLNGWKKAHVI